MARWRREYASVPQDRYLGGAWVCSTRLSKEARVGSNNTGFGNTGSDNTALLAALKATNFLGQNNNAIMHLTNDNTGFANIGNGSSGFANLGNGNSGFFNTGSGNTGSDNLGSGNAGFANTGNGNTGFGFGNTGNGDIGFGNTGSGNGFASPFSGSVTFAGDNGTLKLDNSSSFAGTVAGMTGQDTLDLADMDPGKVQPPSFSGNSLGGTLTVTDGMHTPNVALLGNYMASVFVAQSDGHGGTTITDPVIAAQNQITQPHA
jgi:PPE-repeat protein